MSAYTEDQSEELTPTGSVIGLDPLLPDVDGVNDYDSAIGDDTSSFAGSLKSSIFQHRCENGRTYHSYKESIGYILPNDATEQERLDFQHQLTLLTLYGKLYLAPVGKTRPIGRCLDAGTGTGIWAIDFAEEHPSTEVIGVDISPIQPTFVPNNVTFQIDDLEDDWTYRHKFDFVFARMLVGSITDWPKFFTQSYDSLNPGGWVECQDIAFPVECDDDTLPPNSYIRQWSDCVIEATELIHRSARGARSHKERMTAAGFVNVKEVTFRWPMNRWPADSYYKELGYWTYHNIAGGLDGLSLAMFTRVLHWSPEDVEEFLAKVREEMKETQYHAWWPIVVVYGQKPMM